MIAEISYTDVNGNTTTFKSKSVNAAMKRLTGIKGYCAGFMDDAAAQLAKGFMSKHRNKSRIAGMDNQGANFNGSMRNAKICDGKVAGMQKVMTGFQTDGSGNIDVTYNTHYIGSDGRTLYVGPSKHRNVGSLNFANGSQQSNNATVSSNKYIDGGTTINENNTNNKNVNVGDTITNKTTNKTYNDYSGGSSGGSSGGGSGGSSGEMGGNG